MDVVTLYEGGRAKVVRKLLNEKQRQMFDIDRTWKCIKDSIILWS